MAEQNGPKDLVGYAVSAEYRGFDFEARCSGRQRRRDGREAGFTDIALLQIGGQSQDLFLKEAAEPVLAALRTAATNSDK